MYGSLHISESVGRLSVAGVVLWCGLSAILATVVGVGAWTLGHGAGSGYSPAAVTQLEARAYANGVTAGAQHRPGVAAARARVAAARRRSYERGYAAGYRAGRSATP
jgi:hypothetical protein